MYPLANFGGKPMVAQGGNDAARTAVSKIDTSKPAVLLLDGLQFNLPGQRIARHTDHHGGTGRAVIGCH